MSFNRIYQNIRKQYENNGIQVEESIIRQQAWVAQNKILYEKTHTNNGGRLPIDNQYVEEYIDDYFE
jgi:hypothetical protein